MGFDKPTPLVDATRDLGERIGGISVVQRVCFVNCEEGRGRFRIVLVVVLVVVLGPRQQPPLMDADERSWKFSTGLTGFQNSLSSTGAFYNTYCHHVVMKAGLRIPAKDYRRGQTTIPGSYLNQLSWFAVKRGRI